MSRQFSDAPLWLMLFTMMLLAVMFFTAAAVAQPVDVQPGEGNVASPAPAISPAPAAADHSLALSDGCGCQTEAPCTACGAPARMRHHGYYRAMRQSMTDNECCADCFGGFGPLWETYCADKQRCCGQPCCGAAACECVTVCEPAAPCTPGPCKSLRSRLSSLHLRGLHANRQCDGCGAATASCDCDASESTIPKSGQLNIGNPPVPSEAQQPSVSPTPSDGDKPADEPANKVTSARRGWLNRTIDLHSHR
jgi:hypothetical protein